MGRGMSQITVSGSACPARSCRRKAVEVATPASGCGAVVVTCCSPVPSPPPHRSPGTPPRIAGLLAPARAGRVHQSRFPFQRPPAPQSLPRTPIRGPHPPESGPRQRRISWLQSVAPPPPSTLRQQQRVPPLPLQLRRPSVNPPPHLSLVQLPPVRHRGISCMPNSNPHSNFLTDRLNCPQFYATLMRVTPWFQFRRIAGRWVALHLRQPDNDHITAFTIWSRFWLQLRPTIYAKMTGSPVSGMYIASEPQEGPQ